MKKFFKFLLAGVLAASGSPAAAQGEPAPVPADGIYSFTVKDIDGKDVSLSEFKGKLLLIVNTASRCGYTKQYKPLETLYEQYKDKGLVVLGFPANNFMNQEPGDEANIKQFCELKYKITFPMFSKISVKGDDMAPLFRYLTSDVKFGGEVKWNFNKFLISPDGKVAGRFEPAVDPMSADVVAQIEENLPKP